MNEQHLVDAAVRTLRDPATIRARCASITAWVDAGASPHFTLERARLDAVAQRIAALTRSRFPDLKIPVHSRWRHFEAGGVDRKAELDRRLNGRSHIAAARTRIDLALLSVLLDAGAGAGWAYHEAESGQRFVRSEGLAVASFRAFLAGRFSSDPGDPIRVDAAALLKIDAKGLAEVFQAGPDNPLVGLEGRVALLHRLGEALRARPEVFTSTGQPGHLFDALTHHAHAPRLNHHRPLPTAMHHEVGAGRILGALLESFSGIWPSGQVFHGVPVGDVWPHPAAGGTGTSAGWVPFHKLSQWLAYSLVEPFEWAGVKVHGLDELTGLPEYRNGGLLLDAGVIVPRDAAFAAAPRTPADPWVIEWRALTVTLLDELLPRVRHLLGVPDLPLPCLLEGGSWAAGRQIAAERRPGGAPPVSIESDGTVF
ncbi:MAG: URC4/urg3 family protein [Piscinibacter sp.]|uniref:URC4/urg3 family protein n=1 Tax=Piscinibacter sp. TaxID=1903157 RepID=UPI00258C3B89|nr:URC4/urg3 family protein [Piscinibacter sp.]MCW5665261.1 URC4/urg3 family protein [Piscinibacter sp.]